MPIPRLFGSWYKSYETKDKAAASHNSKENGSTISFRSLSDQCVGVAARS